MLKPSFDQETQLQKEINYIVKEAAKKAEAEAVLNTKIKNAKSLIQLGKLSLEDIASALGLSISQVESLANEISA